MHTAESPLISHSTGDHNVHGVLVRIRTGTGDEVDDAFSVFISERQHSLQVAWDIGNALLAYVRQAALSHPYVRCMNSSTEVA